MRIPGWQIFILTVLFASCSKSSTDNPDPCEGTVKTWAADVNPIIQTYCNQASCHASGSVNGPGPLTSYTQVFNARTVIREAIRSGFMPQDATLNATQRNNIICWIDNGASNN